jgi:hypothetical protein
MNPPDQRMQFRSMKPRFLAALAFAALAGCGGEGGAREGAAAGGAGEWCRIARRDVSMPADVTETSGAVFDPREPGVFWTHNDSGGDPVLYAVAMDGRQRSVLTVTGARNQDWEDLGLGACPGGHCAFIADIGSAGRRKNDPVALYRVALPPAGGGTAEARGERFEARFPGGGQDAEALFVLPDGSIYVISKGQKDPVELYRWPTPLQRGPVDLVRVRELAPEPEQPGDRVTGAGASRDGRWVAVRTYGRLAVYRTAELLGTGKPEFVMDLTPVGEPQGEAVAIDSDGTILLTSEGGQRTVPGRITFLECTLPQS